MPPGHGGQDAENVPLRPQKQAFFAEFFGKS